MVQFAEQFDGTFVIRKLRVDVPEVLAFEETKAYGLIKSWKSLGEQHFCNYQKLKHRQRLVLLPLECDGILKMLNQLNYGCRCSSSRSTKASNGGC